MLSLTPHRDMMRPNPLTSLISLSLLLLLLLPSSGSSLTCKSSCGSIPIHYPFGSGPGCGSPVFEPHISCTDDTLAFSTHTGSYQVQTIDYNNQVLYIQDSSMSTCSATNPSTGFSLDWNAPFTFVDGDIFALLDCSTATSPLYSPSNATSGDPVPLCDTTNAPICSLLYTCPAISTLNAPISTCCIYTPINLGPSFEMDLKKLQCSSYAAVYSFNGAETNPEGWKYGIALKYRFSVDDGYPKACANCEKSNGVCGYNVAELSYSFNCNCGNGMNTTTDCSFPKDSWSQGNRILPVWITGLGLISSWLALFQNML